MCRTGSYQANLASTQSKHGDFAAHVNANIGVAENKVAVTSHKCASGDRLLTTCGTCSNDVVATFFFLCVCFSSYCG